MKKIIISLMLFCFIMANGQEFVVNEYGFCDAKIPTNNYVVINAEGKTANQLYNNALKYVNQKFVKPSEVIEGKVEGEYLKYGIFNKFQDVNVPEGTIHLNIGFSCDLSFKDGKVKFEITNFRIKEATGVYEVKIDGLDYYFYPIFNSSAGFHRSKTRIEIQTYVNNELKKLSEALRAASPNANW